MSVVLLLGLGIVCAFFGLAQEGVYESRGVSYGAGAAYIASGAAAGLLAGLALRWRRGAPGPRWSSHVALAAAAALLALLALTWGAGAGTYRVINDSDPVSYTVMRGFGDVSGAFVGQLALYAAALLLVVRDRDALLLAALAHAGAAFFAFNAGIGDTACDLGVLGSTCLDTTPPHAAPLAAAAVAALAALALGLAAWRTPVAPAPEAAR